MLYEILRLKFKCGTLCNKH